MNVDGVFAPLSVRLVAHTYSTVCLFPRDVGYAVVAKVVWRADPAVYLGSRASPPATWVRVVEAKAVWITVGACLFVYDSLGDATDVALVEAETVWFAPGATDLCAWHFLPVLLVAYVVAEVVWFAVDAVPSRLAFVTVAGHGKIICMYV